MLLTEGARLYCYDPKVERENALREFADHGHTSSQFDFERNFVTCQSAKEAITDAHAIIVLTEWDVFRTYDYDEFYKLMIKPAVEDEGRNILDHAKLRDIGYEVHGIGKGTER